jgi:hypothetical protein
VQFHEFGDAPSGVVFVAEADHALTNEDEALIGDRDPVGVAAEILQHLLGSAPGRFGVDDPGTVLQLAQELCPRLLRGPRGTLPPK